MQAASRVRLQPAALNCSSALRRRQLQRQVLLQDQNAAE
jgi:hypothetical protein